LMRTYHGAFELENLEVMNDPRIDVPRMYGGSDNGSRPSKDYKGPESIDQPSALPT